MSDGNRGQTDQRSDESVAVPQKLMVYQCPVCGYRPPTAWAGPTPPPGAHGHSYNSVVCKGEPAWFTYALVNGGS